MTLAFCQLWHVFNMRNDGAPLLRNDVTRNAFVWGALILCVVLVLGAVYVPGAGPVLHTVQPGLAAWLLVAGTSFVPLLLGPLIKAALFKA